MAATKAKRGDTLVLVGTRKGAFILSSDGARKNWAVSGPHSPGEDVFHAVYDPREGGKVWTAINSPCSAQRYGGATTWAAWQAGREAPKFDADKNLTLAGYGISNLVGRVSPA